MNRLTWAPVATLLATMAIGCAGADGGTSAHESEFARKTAARDAGAEAPSAEGQKTLDGSVVSLDGSTVASSDGGASATTDEETDAALELTDNQIFRILGANNDAELSAAAAAQGKLTGMATIEFARSITRSANAAAARHSLLANLADLTPEESEQSAQRERVAGDIDTMLETEPPSDSLDLYYAFGEAMTNQLLADLIDETLLPQADSALLKSELRTTRETAQRRAREGGALVRALAPSLDPSASEPTTETGDAGTAEPDALDPDTGDAAMAQP